MDSIDPPPAEFVPPVLKPDLPEAVPADPTQAGVVPPVYGVLAEYDNVDDVFLAADKVRKAGFTVWDVHSPFPLHGIDPVMGMRRTTLPYVVMLCAIIGCSTGFFLTMWTMSGNVGLDAIGADALVAPVANERGNLEFFNPWGYSFKGYEYLISGKPFTSLPAYIPVIFEFTILLSAFGAVFGMFLMNALPKLHHPLLKREDFRRATDDRFFIVIEQRDPGFDKAENLLKETKALKVSTVYD